MRSKQIMNKTNINPNLNNNNSDINRNSKRHKQKPSFSNTNGGINAYSIDKINTNKHKYHKHNF